MPNEGETVGKAATWPYAYEVEYRDEVAGLVTAMGEQAELEISAEGKAFLEAAAPSEEDDPTGGFWHEVLNLILLRVLLAVADRMLALETSIGRRALQVNAFNANDFRETLVSVYGVDPRRGGEPWLRPVLAAWEAENLALVRAIPEQYANRLRGEFVRAAVEGRGIGALRDAVREATVAGRAKAAFLARTNLGTLMALLQERRHRDAGVRKFYWRTMLDERVRPTHQARHGRVFRWDVPGPRPGLEPNCRCVAAPVLPALTVSGAL